MSVAYWLNTAWMWSCKNEARKFFRATRDVASSQQAVLQRIILANESTEFGREHGFAGIHSPHEFQQRVPLSTYDNYSEPIQRIAAGHDNVLTHERVELLEPTSGSSNCGEKLIPYTSSLRREFQRAVAAWIANVMQHRPAMRRGRAYWSISPALAATRKSSGGIPIGFDDDAAYLSRLERYFLKYLLIMPANITQLTVMENFRYCTLLYLLSANDLSLISIWSPTFLTSILSSLDEWSDRICRDLRCGSLSVPVPDDPGVKGIGIKDHRRAEQLQRIFGTSGSIADKLRQIWPCLDLISCWTDATAGDYLASLRELFPDVAIQPKGLLATEGCVSFPLVGRSGAALAIRSHFFEFAEVNELSREPPDITTVRLADQLDVGRQYTVIMTTGGGLYRYQLNDIVEVVEFENQCPLLRFVGRADRVSDLVGEKLSERHLQEVMRRVLPARGIFPRFSLVIPIAGPQPCYRLCLHANEVDQLRAESSRIANDIDAGLRENPYYQHAVEFGQLGPLEVQILNGDYERVWRVYERVCLARGQKPGDVKPGILDTWMGWADEFDAVLANDSEQRIV